MANDNDVDAIGGIGDKKSSGSSKSGEAAGAHAASQTSQPQQQAPQQQDKAATIDTQDKVSISKEARGLE